MNKKIENFIDGDFIESGGNSIPVWNPQEGKIIAEVNDSSSNDLNIAVKAAKSAYIGWSNKTLKERTEIFYEFRNQLIDNLNPLSESICEENGKTFQEAKAEVLKGIELTEFACSMPHSIIM